MGAVSVVRKLIGMAQDSMSIAGEIDRLKSECVAATDEAMRLDLAAQVAETRAAAKALEDQSADCRWRASKAATALPGLEADLAATKAREQAAALERHRVRRQAIYLKLKGAVLEAVAVQVEALAADRQACIELGEHLARMHLPAIAFRGLLLPDLTKLWTDEQDRIFEALAGKPAAVVPAAAPAVKRKPLAESLQHAVGGERRAAPKPAPRPAMRCARPSPTLPSPWR